MRTKVYLAARWGRQAEIREYRDHLLRASEDVTVTSSWLDIIADGNLSAPFDGRTLHECAQQDLLDIAISNVFVLFTEQTHFSTGRMVEFGYALSAVDTVCVVGPRENLFCHLDEVFTFDTWEDFLRSDKWK